MDKKRKNFLFIAHLTAYIMNIFINPLGWIWIIFSIICIMFMDKMLSVSPIIGFVIMFFVGFILFLILVKHLQKRRYYRSSAKL